MNVIKLPKTEVGFEQLSTLFYLILQRIAVYINMICDMYLIHMSWQKPAESGVMGILHKCASFEKVSETTHPQTS